VIRLLVFIIPPFPGVVFKEWRKARARDLNSAAVQAIMLFSMALLERLPAPAKDLFLLPEA
jgi:hypothetical protein